MTAPHPSVRMRLLAPVDRELAEPDVDIHLLVAQAAEAHNRADGRLDIHEADDSVVPDEPSWLIQQVTDIPELLDWALLCAIPDPRAAIRLAIVGEVARRVTRATDIDLPSAERHRRRYRRPR